MPSVSNSYRAAFAAAALLFFYFPLPSHAHSAVAWVSGQPVLTIYAGWNFSTQTKADQRALQGCRKLAKENNLSQLASKCKVGHRQKNPGAGAIVCGTSGCASEAGYRSQQEAMDVAYKSCEAENYGDCTRDGITTWWDDSGYRVGTTRTVSTPRICIPPAGRAVRSATQCTNGDCTRTFENGCSIRFQASYCRDLTSGNWDWKPDGC